MPLGPRVFTNGFLLNVNQFNSSAGKQVWAGIYYALPAHSDYE